MSAFLFGLVYVLSPRKDVKIKCKNAGNSLKNSYDIVERIH